MIHGAYVIMVVEHISNKEKVILLGAILQGAAQVFRLITDPVGVNVGLVLRNLDGYSNSLHHR
ncbi:hypothetical protein GCM10027295_11330 [Pseudaeromonas pectinilytica]